jgi:hypothetical protein
MVEMVGCFFGVDEGIGGLMRLIKVDEVDIHRL